MSFHLSRRQFVLLAGATAFGAGGYGLARAVRRVRDTADRLSSQ